MSDKFLDTSPNPMKLISGLINANLGVFGNEQDVPYLLAQVQSEINHAIDDLNKLQEVK